MAGVNPAPSPPCAVSPHVHAGLIGLKPQGPGEKVAWWVNFTFRGEACQLAFQKFVLRLYLRTQSVKSEAAERMDEIVRKLQAAVRVVEKVVLAAAPDLLSQGDATVVNQHRTLRRSYEYFRARATDPDFTPDEEDSGESPGGGTWQTFKSGQTQMRLNAFHDIVATLSAYVSLLQHDLVLALAFGDFDPETDDLTEIIGSRWGDKWTASLVRKGTRRVSSSGSSMSLSDGGTRTRTAASRRVTARRSTSTIQEWDRRCRSDFRTSEKSALLVLARQGI